MLWITVRREHARPLDSVLWGRLSRAVAVSIPSSRPLDLFAPGNDPDRSAQRDLTDEWYPTGLANPQDFGGAAVKVDAEGVTFQANLVNEGKDSNLLFE